VSWYLKIYLDLFSLGTSDHFKNFRDDISCPFLPENREDIIKMALGSKLGYKRVHIGPISECPKPKTDL
jgi:hypothetical protein